MIEQQAGEGSVALQAAEICLRDHTAEQRSVSAESVGVDFGFGVYVGAVRNQPARDLDLVEIHTHMKQSGSGQRRAVQREGMVGVASQLRRIDVLV